MKSQHEKQFPKTLLESLKSLIEDEDKSKPLTDKDMAKILNLSRSHICAVRRSSKIPAARLRLHRTPSEEAAYKEELRQVRLERTRQWKKENRQYCLDYMRNWKQENKEHVKQYKREYYADSPEYREWIKNYNSEHKEKYKERIREVGKIYREKNADKLRETQQDYYYNRGGKEKEREHRKANPAKYCAWQSKRKARVKDALLPDSDLGEIEQFYILARKITEETGIEHEVDHIIPVKIGGAHHQDNLQVLSWKENSLKRAKYIPELGGVWADNDLAREYKKKHGIG